MNEKPMLFRGPMVQAILAGRKTQTRRIVKRNASGRVQFFGKQWHIEDSEAINGCPQGGAGNLLWVKETFCKDWKRDAVGGTSMKTRYRADGYKPNAGTNWKPSIFMPRTASRITLEIVSVRVERLQDISEADAIAEGCEPEFQHAPDCVFPDCALAGGVEDCAGLVVHAKENYKDLWESINGAGSWSQNPWVWVIEFKKL